MSDDRSIAPLGIGLLACERQAEGLKQDRDAMEAFTLPYAWALMPGLPSHPDAGAEHARHAVGRSGGLAPPEVLQEAAKPVSTDAAGNANQGMSVALSADGSTAIVGGPGPNDVDRDARPLSALPGRHGYSFAAVVCGHSRAVNWLARPTHLEGGCFPRCRRGALR